MVTVSSYYSLDKFKSTWKKFNQPHAKNFVFVTNFMRKVQKCQENIL